jgi:hypothetical protein
MINQWTHCKPYGTGAIVIRAEISYEAIAPAVMIIKKPDIHHGPVIKRGKGKYKKW